MHRTIVDNEIQSIICSCLFFCTANIYRPSQGKVRLGRPNPKPIQPRNFYLRRKRKNPFYSELYAQQCIENQFSILIFISFEKNIKNFVSKNMSKYLTMYRIIIYIFFFLNQASILCCEVFADVNAIYITSLWWIMIVWTLKRFSNSKNPTFGKTHFNNIFTMKVN